MTIKVYLSNLIYSNECIPSFSRQYFKDGTPISELETITGEEAPIMLLYELGKLKFKQELGVPITLIRSLPNER